MDVGSWIPHFFYDLIGRIVPGTIVITIGVCILQPPQRIFKLYVALNSAHALVGTLVVVGGVISSYILGALLGEIGHRAGRLIGKSEEKDKEEELSRKYHYVLIRGPMAGAGLAKIKAERHLTRVLVVGLGALLLLYLYLVSIGAAAHTPRAACTIVAGLIAAAFGAFVLNRHSANEECFGIKTSYDILKEAKEKEAKQKDRECHSK
jgi:protein-S-isoprenylcysteine O-methyltransferase Ste14